MEIKKAIFLQSNTDYRKCPIDDKPEYAFIGRSNVGKSSLINMLVNNKKLALTSSRPGKTQLINHFLINDNWYLVDLPGYGYAKISKTSREKWSKMITDYLVFRDNLMLVFLLIDSRIPPQSNDLDFINKLATANIPFGIVFTKTDKNSKNQTNKNVEALKNILAQDWEQLPKIFISSAETRLGKEDILNYIEDCNKLFVRN